MKQHFHLTTRAVIADSLCVAFFARLPSAHFGNPNPVYVTIPRVVAKQCDKAFGETGPNYFRAPAEIYFQEAWK